MANVAYLWRDRMTAPLWHPEPACSLYSRQAGGCFSQNWELLSQPQLVMFTIFIPVERKGQVRSCHVQIRGKGVHWWGGTNLQSLSKIPLLFYLPDLYCQDKNEWKNTGIYTAGMSKNSSYKTLLCERDSFLHGSMWHKNGLKRYHRVLSEPLPRAFTDHLTSVADGCRYFSGPNLDWVVFLFFFQWHLRTWHL